MHIFLTMESNLPENTNKATLLNGSDTDSAEYETDLEDDFPSGKSVNDPNGKLAYISACERLNVVPVSYFLENLTSTSVTLMHRGLCDRGAQAIAEAMKINTTLKELRLPDNSIGVLGAQYLSSMLSENLYLKELDLSNNKISSRGLRFLVTALTQNRTLESLNLSNNRLLDEDAKKIGKLLLKNRVLKHLVLSYNKLSEAAGEAIGDALCFKSSLRSLDLSWNSIRGDGAIAIAHCLTRNNCLRQLSLGWNGFTDDGAICIGQALIENKVLEELDLSYNRISESGAKGLAIGLSSHSKLKVLCLGWNPLGLEGIRETITALASNPGLVLQELHLNSFLISEDSKLKLDDILRRNPDMKIVIGGYRRMDPNQFDEDAFRREVLNILRSYLISKRLRMVDLFNMWDKDKSFSITRQEFRNGVKACRIPLTETQLTILVQWLDQDGSDSIEYPEFVAITEIE